jgi:hypothetical protein
MNINTAEKSLAHYHILHFLIGVTVAAILLAVPKLFGVLFAVFLVAMILPSAILPDFSNKGLDRAATLVGAVIVGLLFYFLHKV